ncbi:MAG: hypothetical protein QM762_24310 [Chryseolinea sp.]
MGFNVSGLVINKNYKANFDALQKELGWNLQKQADILFEEASSNWKDDGICDVYFSEKGTLMFISMDMCAEAWGLKEANTLTFALSETSMAFNLNYCEKGVEKRSIMSVEDNRMSDEGAKLEVESKSEDVSEIIWNQMEVVLGKSFWSIDPGEKAERYIFVKEKKQEPTAVENEDRVREVLAKSPAMRALLEEELRKRQVTAKPEKKWWRFWE